MKNIGRIYILTLFALVIACTLKAADPYRDHRYEGFTVLNTIPDGGIVFIGNSITHMMDWNDALGAPNIYNRGTSGATTMEILDYLEAMIAGNPAKVFLMIGTNDLAYEGDAYAPVNVAQRIETILERISQECPETRIYYQSILPSKRGLRTREKTEKTNAFVKKWIESHPDKNIEYIDLYGAFVDSEGSIRNTSMEADSFAISYDDLHLSQKGYKIWLDIIADKTGHNPIFPEDAYNVWGGLGGTRGMRTTYFGALPVDSADVLLIGDDMIHSGEWNELLNDNAFKDRGMGWGLPAVTISGITRAFNAIFLGNSDKGVQKDLPKSIVFYCGITDILDGKTADEVIESYRMAIDSLKFYAPGVLVFVTTILPAPDSDLTRNAVINDVNDGIKLFAANNNLNLIDFNSAVTDANGRHEDCFYNEDSYYISGIGYVKIACALADGLNKRLGTDYKPLTENEAFCNKNRFREKIDSVQNNESFKVFDNGTSNIPYRIPAIAVANNGDIIAVADYRYSGQDIGVEKDGRVDLRFKRKNHETGGWNDEETLIEAGVVNGVFTAYGDPCIVADSESDRVLVTCCAGNVSFQKGTHENHQDWVAFYSEDNGKTWTTPNVLTDQVFEQLDRRNDGEIKCFFIGSGKIAQSKLHKADEYYRLYCAALVRTAGDAYANYVFYSDDFGLSWKLLGTVEDCPIPEGGDEPKVEELPDGNILISSRISGGRAFNKFTYSDIERGEGKWGRPAVSNSETNGVVASLNACNGEILMIPVKDNVSGETLNLLLQSVPFGPEGRSHVGINYKVLKSGDDYATAEAIANDWDGTYGVSLTTSAYSTMTVDAEGNIAFLFEENGLNGGYDIVYISLPVEKITFGRYSYKKV